MCGPHRVALVDDDSPTRRHLHRIVESHERFRVIAETGNGRGAIDVLRTHRPQLAFLGIRPPALDGFDVLRELPTEEWPLVVFCSEDADYALLAFELNAVDYLLEPLHENRVRGALDRAALRLEEPNVGERRRLEALLLEAQREIYVQRLPVRHADHVEFVELDDVEWIGAAANYVELHVDGHRRLYRSTLADLAGRLDPRKFARVHRSAIVNLQRIHGLEGTHHGEWILTLDTGVRLRLSRSYRDVARRLLCGEPHEDAAEA